MKRALVSGTKEPEKPEFCQSMVDASPMPMAFVEGKNHKIRYINPVFRLLMGETEWDLIGIPFSEAVPGSSECVSMLDRVYRTGQSETFFGQEHFPSHPQYFSYVIWPVLAASGQRVGLMHGLAV